MPFVFPKMVWELILMVWCVLEIFTDLFDYYPYNLGFISLAILAVFVMSLKRGET